MSIKRYYFYIIIKLFSRKLMTLRLNIKIILTFIIISVCVWVDCIREVTFQIQP